MNLTSMDSIINYFVIINNKRAKSFIKYSVIRKKREQKENTNSDITTITVSPHYQKAR